MSKGKVGEVLKLLGSGKQVKVLFEGFSKLNFKDWESRNVDKHFRNWLIIEQFLNEGFARFGGWERLSLQVLEGNVDLVKDDVLVDVLKSVVLDLHGGVFTGGFNCVHWVCFLEERKDSKSGWFLN